MHVFTLNSGQSLEIKSPVSLNHVISQLPPTHAVVYMTILCMVYEILFKNIIIIVASNIIIR